jgi:hypothetical protein
MRVPFLRHTARVALCWVLITSGLPVAADDPPPIQIEQIPEECIPPFFGDSGVPRAIDSANTGCGLGGEPDLDTPAGQAKQDAQNRVKNQFCAWQQSTEPALVTRKSFDQLQSQLPDGVPFGTRTNMPTAEQRELLREFYTTTEGDIIGEGLVCAVCSVHFGGTLRWWRERQLWSNEAGGRGYSSRIGHREAHYARLEESRPRRVFEHHCRTESTSSAHRVGHPRENDEDSCRAETHRGSREIER